MPRASTFAAPASPVAARPAHGPPTPHARLRFRPETRVSGRRLAARLFALGAPEEHALAARAEDHLCVALDLVEELGRDAHRSEEHTSELQSRLHLVCRLLLEKKKKCSAN